MTALVIVESPAKGKTINKYLGKDYEVIASYGHVRDLPSKNGSVDPDNGFSMVWESEARAKKQIAKIIEKAEKHDEIILATDPDREGEAISWHIYDILKSKRKLKDKPIKRVAFHEVTKSAILDAMKNARDIDENLVNAYLARRAMDYLVGFTLSPVLWRKLPGSKSAGRVQSVALRLIADRELEIDAFVKEEYWTIDALLEKCGNSDDNAVCFRAKMTHLLGEKLEKFSISNEKDAKDAVSKIDKDSFKVSDVEKKQKKRNPYAPFITSTLQQDASRKLGFSARKTMQIAQQLYEGVKIDKETTGLITYMRTDSVSLSKDAIEQIRDHILSNYGEKYLPSSPKVYKSKSKNAQEAHEAIRPTNIKDFRPEKIKQYLDADQFKLYELIYKRTVSSQMESAVLDQVTVDMSDNNKNIFRATGSTINFDGFLKIYEEGKDDSIKDDGKKNSRSSNTKKEEKLPHLSVGEAIAVKDISPEQHFTQPPPRYTEASLVKKLEELGIGRPSTYATIIHTLQARKYVRIEKKQFIPEPRGRVVTTFLEEYFGKYVEYDFTAKLEELLDDIANKKADWQRVLSEFWKPFKERTTWATTLKNSDIIDFINRSLAIAVFGKDESARICPKCKTGKLTIKLGRYGAFIGCSSHPECDYIKKWDESSDDESKDSSTDSGDNKNYEVFEPVLLGKDPNTGFDITLRKGPYGFYFQWDEDIAAASSSDGAKTSPKKKGKPKRASLPKGLSPDDATLEHALKVGSLPRTLGIHPETKEELITNVGRYGPYVKHGSKFISIKGKYDPIDITLEEAIKVVDESLK